MPCLLGIDSGLTVTKAVLFDIDGRTLSVARRRVAQSFPHPRHVERDMDEFWNATADAIAEAIATSGRPASDILAIATTAHGDGIYMLDSEHRPLGAGILSLDSRAVDIAENWVNGAVAEQSIAITGQLPHASAPSAILAWVKENEPERFSRIAHVIACKDWLRFCLTGEVGTDRTEASTSFTDVQRQDYSRDALALFGLEALWNALPPMSRSDEIVGGVSAACAARTGLVAGTPVVGGLHDVTASALGVGGLKMGTVAVVAGTYSINETLSSEPHVNPNWFCRNGIAPGEWNNMSISPASTANYDWFLDKLCPSERRLSEETGRSIHDMLRPEIDAALAKPSTALFHPYLFGSPYGAMASGAFFGLRGWQERGDMLRAVWEGIAFNHRIHVDHLKEGFAISAARLTGGVSRSPAFAQMFANVLGMPVTVTETDEAAAWGAALCAGKGAGVFADVYSDPRDLDAIGCTYTPDVERSTQYKKRFALFKEIASALGPLWPKIEALSD
ncbi:FGGY-family carbohydrate kinase [Ochrobactrum teleogrylli]|uniref:Carbohydrate kinase n=1 Tax=Ochrobactrum teleogrylli TaxID=2479765 RepID=A0ABY2Y2X6_9HYPH|nr:FGGY-family carbohydrate kinase [[Ochrobactrum] teleogrylli]TNV12343.1 carbohydrate kinase [[Ochrobactrum] teleogrylli]